MYIIIMSEREKLKCSSARFPSAQQECSSLLGSEGNGYRKVVVGRESSSGGAFGSRGRNRMGNRL